MADGSVSRRKFVQVGTVALATVGLSGGVKAQTTDSDDGYQAVSHLVGADSALPSPSSDFFANKTQYAYLYEARDTGATYFIDDSRDSWDTLSIRGSSLALVARDLSSVSPSDGVIYRHDGSGSITADGTSTTETGYYCWSETDGEFKTVVAF